MNGNAGGKGREMDFIIQAVTDIGNVKETNQDSLSVKIINTEQGKVVFAVLCDGMGGLSKGEVASACVIRAFEQWVYEKLPSLSGFPWNAQVLEEQWAEIIRIQNAEIKNYGREHGCALGTTAVVMLLTQDEFYIANVGDSRVYELKKELRQLTSDQTLVAEEMRKGMLTKEQAKTDPRRSVLLQCIGASERVYPDMYTGKAEKDTVYLLCSDGFHHEITKEEIAYYLQPSVLKDDKVMRNHAEYLISLDKQRQERDNISVVLIRTF